LVATATPAAAPPAAPIINNHFSAALDAAAPATATFDMLIDVDAVWPWCDAVTRT